LEVHSNTISHPLGARCGGVLQESSSSTPTGKQDKGRLLVPDHMGWIATMWHFGVDGDRK